MKKILSLQKLSLDSSPSDGGGKGSCLSLLLCGDSCLSVLIGCDC